jgi:6-phosphogluconate dehydrogenase
MPGGPREAYELIEPIIKKCAAQVGDPEEPCTGYCGPIGAGNYVKMVHNGIEYGDMQLIGEVYDLLKVMRQFVTPKKAYVVLVPFFFCSAHTG